MQEVLVATQEVEDILTVDKDDSMEKLSEQDNLKDVFIQYYSAIQQIIQEQYQVIHLLEKIVSQGKLLGGGGY